jgi:transcription elongation factor Elf1
MSNEKRSDERLDRLCQNCGQAFSVFLNEMAEHNAKVAACPLCGKAHSYKHPKADKPAAAVRPLRKTTSKR